MLSILFQKYMESLNQHLQELIIHLQNTFEDRESGTIITTIWLELFEHWKQGGDFQYWSWGYADPSYGIIIMHEDFSLCSYQW